MTAAVRQAQRAGRPETEEAALWQDLQETGSARARERLFALHFPLARRLAARFFRNDAKSSVEYDDLLQWASAGLLEAIDGYRPDLGVPFRYYGNRRISGSILNGIATHSEVNQQISFSRRVARERIASLKKDMVKTQNLDEALALLGDIAAGLAIGMMLDESRMFSVDDRDPAKSPYQTLAWKQMLILLADELSNLAEREHAIIRMHYIEGLGFEEIGRVFGVTKGRISQIHKAAIALLRKRLLKTGRFRLES